MPEGIHVISHRLSVVNSPEEFVSYVQVLQEVFFFLTVNPARIRFLVSSLAEGAKTPLPPRKELKVGKANRSFVRIFSTPVPLVE